MIRLHASPVVQPSQHKALQLAEGSQERRQASQVRSFSHEVHQVGEAAQCVWQLDEVGAVDVQALHLKVDQLVEK